jgi:predicted phosphodiesterase
MRIGVVGDIHGNYRGLKQAVQEMGLVEMLLFTGDGYREISRLQTELDIRVEGVVGNCDFSSIYPVQQLVYLENCKILLTHGHLYGVKND